MSENQAETVARLARDANAAVIVKTEDGRQFLITSGQTSAKEVSDPHGLIVAKPVYVKANETLQTVDSLVEYIERFKVASTLLFADVMGNSIVGIIDYHTPSRNGDGDRVVPAAERLAHRATMTLPLSEEWKTWTGVHNQLKSQLDFARFIEENAVDVTAPDGAELLEVVKDLQAHRKVSFASAVRTASDNENFEFSHETQAGTRTKGIEIPTKFQLKIPVYFGEPPTELYAFLRWRLDEGALLLGVALHRAEYVRQAVFQQIVLSVGSRTNCGVMFGKIS